jgi:hypothetical protein
MSSITTCPTCDYTRQPTDVAPDWLCPKCYKSYTESTREINNRRNVIDAGPLVLFLFGAMFLYGGSYCLFDVSSRLVRNLHLVHNGTAGIGRVVDYKESPGGRDRRIWPVVSFTGPNGEAVIFESRYHPNYSGYSVGQPVSILFDPKDPRIAEINEPERLWGRMAGLYILGILFVTLGGGGMFLSVKSLKKSKSRCQ